MSKEALLSGCTFTELALAYMPDDLPQSAARTLRTWVNRNAELKRELMALGYQERGRQRLTPRMVRLIFRMLGEP